MKIIKSVIVLLSVIFGIFTGRTLSENKRLNNEVRGVRISRKIEEDNSKLTRKQLIDKL